MKNKTRFEELLQKDNTMEGDTERQALFWILANNETLYSKVKAIYDFEDHSINPDCLEHMVWSSAEEKLLYIAFNLYNGFKFDDNIQRNYTLIDLLDVLDYDNMQTVLGAIEKRFPRKFDSAMNDKINKLLDMGVNEY